MAEAEEAALASSAKKPSSKSAGTPKVQPAVRLFLWTLCRPFTGCLAVSLCTMRA